MVRKFIEYTKRGLQISEVCKKNYNQYIISTVNQSTSYRVTPIKLVIEMKSVAKRPRPR